MKKVILSSIALATTFLPACTSDGLPAEAPAAPAPVNPIQALIFQNPFMAPNPFNNIHCDSYMSDSYPYPGPSSGSQPQLSQVEEVRFNDPFTGEARHFVLGECAGQALDADGNIQTISAGIADRTTDIVQRDVVTLDRNTLQVLAFTSFSKQQTSATDFGGAGYFYQDNQFRMVVALPDGHVQVLERQDSPLSEVDKYVPVQDYNVCGEGGAAPLPEGVTSLSLYAVVPDKAGNIWWTTAEGVVGTITPTGEIRSYDINAPGGAGPRVAQADGGFEAIANSHATDEGDGPDLPSGVYIITTYNLYRFGAGPDGTPRIDWKGPYDRGTGIKPGQVSFGSGTSPTVFQMDGRRFVTIADNAALMNVNVYRAETALGVGEERLFAQVTPFGNNTQVSDENSLIVAPAPDGGTNIYAENNFGYLGPATTLGTGVTEPGFARMLLSPSGEINVASLNLQVRVPTIVSKISIPSGIVYTWEKQASGWYLTGLDANDLNSVRFTVLAGTGPQFNNHYSALSLDPDGRTVYLGTLFGLTRMVLNP